MGVRGSKCGMLGRGLPRCEFALLLAAKGSHDCQDDLIVEVKDEAWAALEGPWEAKVELLERIGGPFDCRSTRYCAYLS